MPRPKTPRTPRTPADSATSSTTAKTNLPRADWAHLCVITAHRILRRGFVIEYLLPNTSVQLGAELKTGVALIVSAGRKGAENVSHTDPGVADGIRDIATEGLSGRMILYGVAFHFVPTAQ